MSACSNVLNSLVVLSRNIVTAFILNFVLQSQPEDSRKKIVKGMKQVFLEAKDFFFYNYLLNRKVFLLAFLKVIYFGMN